MMTTEATPIDLGSHDQLSLVERLWQRTLPKHGGREADSWAHHWNLTPGDSELHAEAAKRLQDLELEAAFYKRRVQDPER